MSTTSAEPSLTVAIPTTGRWSSLRTALDSLAPGYPAGVDVPTVVLSGCCGPIPHEFRICQVREPTRGPGAARNAAMRSAATDWVVFLDDDCAAPPGWLALIAGRLAEWGAAHIGVAGGVVVEPERRGVLYGFMRDLNYMHSADLMKVRVGGIPSLGGANLVVHRRCWTDVGGFDESLVSTEDFDFLLRANRAGWAVGTYFDVPPVVHAHTTTARTFVRRYHGYGRGVAQMCVSNGLDFEQSRVYVRRSLVSLSAASARFAREDLQWMSPHATSPLALRGPLAFLRAAAWQSGAWRVRRRPQA